MNKYIVVFILFSLSVFAQENWEKIGKSEIYYSNFYSKKETNTYDLKYEYFKNGFDLIVVEKNLGETFKLLFQENPKAFYDVFNNVYDILVVDENDKFSNLKFLKDYYLDFSLITDLNFNRATILSERRIIRGFNEIIWNIRNGIDVEPCYINIIFKKNKKMKKLDYLIVQKDHCEI